MNSTNITVNVIVLHVMPLMLEEGCDSVPVPAMLEAGNGII